MDDKDFEKFKNMKYGDMTKKQRDAYLGEVQKRKNDRRDAEAHWEAAEREAGGRLDRQLEQDFKDMFGDWRKDVEDAVGEAARKNPTDSEVQAAAKAIQDARKAQKGGWFSRGNTAKARKIIKRNKTKINKAKKKGKKGFWS